MRKGGGGAGTSCTSPLTVQITIRNVSPQEIEVQYSANRCAIAFVVMDQRENVVQPVGVAKVDPRNSTIKLKPGETFEHALDQYSQLAHAKGLTLPFLTSTGLFAYDLKDGGVYNRCLLSDTLADANKHTVNNDLLDSAKST